MRPVTIGTAGHIDHGKSALVRALTGIDPDRLAEEQRRGMTLDLGFAHLDLPGGRRIGIVDVPGHEALIHNMLAGAGGIDLVMLVVAADEGAMPQTREHLDIIRFLPASGGVIVLSKIDLASDADWLTAVEEDLHSLTVGTPLEHAPVVRVSARTGEGLPDLVAALDRLVAGLPPRPADGAVRLPIDRSFTMQGFGTVVTGTLWSGTIRPGDVLVLLPESREVRVRGVQVHGTAVPAAYAGSRAAVNLSGLDKREIARGDVLATPGAFAPTERLEVRLRLLPSAPQLKQSSPVHIHLGSGTVVGRITFPDRAALAPGEEGVARVRLEAPIVAIHGDRFVARRYSPTTTIGGGVVLNAAASLRRRRYQTPTEPAPAGGPEALVIAAVAAVGPSGLPAGAIAAAAGVEAAAAADAVASALGRGELVQRGERLFALAAVETVRRRITEALSAHHAHVPWRHGMSREDLKSRAAAGAEDRLFDEVLAELVGARTVVERGALLALSDFTAAVDEVSQRVRARVLASIEQAGASPPTADELRRLASPEIVDRALQGLVDDGLVVAVTPELRFAASVLERIRVEVVEVLRGGGEVTVATLRDRLQTSRRYALAVLEYFDRIRITRRIGDRRVLGPQADAPLPPPR